MSILEARVRADHPLRAIRAIVNEALAALSGEFAALYARIGRPSIPPEKLLRAMLLQAFYSIRSERQLMERLEFDLLFRWFVGLGVDDAAWDHSTFSKNRDRLLEGRYRGEVPGGGAGAAAGEAAAVERAFLGRRHADRSLGVDEELQAEGRLGRAAGGRQRDATREADFHGQKRSNETHASTTDPDARLYRKGPGKEAKLCFMGHALMENRYGLVVDACLTQADGHAERSRRSHMIEPRADRPAPITLGADKGYDAEDFVNELRSMNVTPHVAQNTNGRRSAIDGRTTRHAGYAVSQRIRKRIEEAFGWIKTVGRLARTKLRGAERVGAHSPSPSRPTISSACRGCSRHDQGESTPGEQGRRRREKPFHWRRFFSGLLVHRRIHSLQLEASP